MMFTQLSDYIHAQKMFFLPSWFWGVLSVYYWLIVKFQFPDFS